MIAGDSKLTFAGCHCVRGLLSWVTAASAVAQAALGARGISPLGELCYVYLGLSEAVTRSVELGLAAVLLASAAVVLLPRTVVGALIAQIGSLVVAVCMVATGVAAVILGGALFSDWTLAADATRYTVPMGLYLLALDKRGSAFWLLRIGAAATFTIHGVEALASSPRFLDLILISDLRINEWVGGKPIFDQASARLFLLSIGGIDLVLALFSLIYRSRPLWIYMAFWGLITALSRMVAGGLDWWPAALERIPNAGAPLALALLVGKEVLHRESPLPTSNQ